MEPANRNCLQHSCEQLLDNLAKDYGKIRKEISENMGGKVLDHEAKDVNPSVICH